MPNRERPAGGDALFWGSLTAVGGVYVVLVAALLVVLIASTNTHALAEALTRPEIRYAASLSLASATLSTLIGLWVAVPLALLLSRAEFRGKWVIESIVDLPLVLPPLVVGLALLLLFQSPAGRWFQANAFAVTFEPPSIILAQFTVTCALSTRTLRAVFDHIDRRPEDVARTLGASRGQALWAVTLPQCRRGLVTAATVAWARGLGEFGPVLVFSGVTRLRTEVLPTSVFLELNRGRLDAAVAVSLLMLFLAVVVLAVARRFGLPEGGP